MLTSRREATREFNSIRMIQVTTLWLELLLPRRAKLIADAPLWKLRRIGNAIAHREVEIEVLHCAAQVPTRLDLVRRLVIVVRGVFVAHLHAIPRGLADEIQ